MTANQYGFSLVEVLLVLGIIAVLAAFAFIIYPRVQLAVQVHYERSALRASVQDYVYPFLATGAKNFGINATSQNGNTAPKASLLEPLKCVDYGTGSAVCDSHLSNLSVGYFTQYPGDGSERLIMLSYTYENMDSEKCIALFAGGGLSSMLASAALTQSVAFSSDPSMYPDVSNASFGLSASPVEIVGICSGLKKPSDGDPSTGAGMSYNAVTIIFDPLNSHAYEPFVNCHTRDGICP